MIVTWVRVSKKWEHVTLINYVAYLLESDWKPKLPNVKLHLLIKGILLSLV